MMTCAARNRPTTTRPSPRLSVELEPHVLPRKCRTAHNLPRPAGHGVTQDRQRADQTLAPRPAQDLADEPLARHAQQDGPAEPLELLQPGQLRQRVLERLAEADARINDEVLAVDA